MVLTIAFIISVFVLIVVVKTLLFKSKQEMVAAVEPISIDVEPVLARLSKAIQLKTISSQEMTASDLEPFLEFHTFLEQSYPLIHRDLEREVINDYSLLYKWPGSDESLKPVVFLAHIDVVPVEPGTEKDWRYDAYSGQVADGFIWGRGTMDMKATLTGLMEAVEELINQGFQPQRSFYFAFGHDEETGGIDGAARIAEHLKNKGVEAAFTMDEGMAILNEALSPSKKKLALIGIAEKGYLTLKLTAKTEGGHSSMPPSETTLGVLSQAIDSLEKNQMPASLSGVVGRLFDYIAPEMSLAQKTLLANRWLFKGLILSRLGKTNSMNAMIRTTTAPTMIRGGVKENVLPSHAYALVNFRLLSGNTISDVIEHVKKVINNPAVEVTAHGRANSEASPISELGTLGYKTITQTVRQMYADTSVAPGLVMGGTDSKHYTSIGGDNYRFAPIIYGPDDPGRIHGTDERLSIDDYIKSIQFYVQLMKTVSVDS